VDVAAHKDLKVRVEEYGNETASKTALVSCKGAKVQTPSRGLFLSSNPLSESRLLSNQKYRGINEVYKRLGSETVDAIDEDADYQRRFQSKLIPTNLGSILQNELLLTVFSLEERRSNGKWEPWEPTNRQLDYLTDFLFGIPFNNVVIPPAIRGLDGEKYVAFLREFFERIPSQQSAVVAGLVPNGSHRDVKAVLDFYYKKGLTAYVLDFQGRTPLCYWSLLPAFSSHLWKVQKEFGPHYAHALNVRYGMKIDRAGFVPARDMLLLLECFDSFGGSHIAPRFSEEFRKKLEEGDVLPTKPRFFDHRAYGYYTPDDSAVQAGRACVRFGIQGPVSSRDLDDPAKLAGVCKAINAAATAVECRALATKISTGEEMKYLQSKQAVVRDTHRVKAVKAAYGPETHESTIDDWI